MEKFIIPVNHNGKIYVGGELIKLRGGVLADAEKSTNDMIGIVKLVSGCLSSITDNNGEITSNVAEIEGIVRHMPYQTAEYLALKIFTNRSDGAIEQIVHCPRCKDKHIYEYINDEVDDRIRFDELEVKSCDNETSPIITVKMESPIDIKNSKTEEVLYHIESMTLRMPDMNDGINASMKYGDDDGTRMQYQMYVLAIETINGSDVDLAFKNNYGMLIFNKMDIDDIESIGNQIGSYGLIKRKDRTCTKCGKNFKFVVDTSSFFA